MHKKIVALVGIVMFCSSFVDVNATELVAFSNDHLKKSRFSY